MTEMNLFRSADVKLELSAGEVVFEKGDPAEHLYGVLSGAVDIVRDDGKVLETITHGGVFGEVALLVGHQRTLNAVVSADAVLAQVDEAEFIRLVKMNPYFALGMMRFMAERLQQ